MPPKPKFQGRVMEKNELLLNSDHNEIKSSSSSSSKITTSLYTCAILGAAGACQFGLHIGVVNAPQANIQSDLNLSTIELSLVVASFAIAAFAGATIAPRFVDSWGRRAFLIALEWFHVFGGGLCIAVAFLKNSSSSSIQLAAYALLLLARISFGFGSGCASVAVPMYLGEIAPLHLKGSFGALNQFGIVVLLLVGQLISLGMSGSSLWAWMFAIPGVIGLLFIFTAQGFLLESPRWLVSKSKFDEARDVLVKFRGYSAEDADAEIAEYVEDSNDGGEDTDGKEKKQISLSQIIADPVLRAPLIVACVLQLTQQFSGINAVFFYSTSFFEDAVSSPGDTTVSARAQTVATWGTIATGAINVIATAASIPLIERAGRKPLLLWAIGGMLVCALLLTGVLAAKTQAPAYSQTFGWLSIVFVLIYVVFFEVGLGAIPWSIGGEMFPEDSRATAMSAAAACNWAGTTAVGFFFPILQEALGNYSFVPFAAWLLGGFVFVLFMVPETKNKTPAELLRWFGARSGASYSSVNTRDV